MALYGGSCEDRNGRQLDRGDVVTVSRSPHASFTGEVCGASGYLPFNIKVVRIDQGDTDRHVGHYSAAELTFVSK